MLTDLGIVGRDRKGTGEERGENHTTNWNTARATTAIRYHYVAKYTSHHFICSHVMSCSDINTNGTTRRRINWHLQLP